MTPSPPKLGEPGFCQGGVNLLTLELDDVLEELVAGRNGLRVGLEVTLSADHVDELGGDIDVGVLEGLGEDRTAAAGSGFTDQG